MFRTALVWFLALATGVGFGYLAWGEQDRRAESDLVRDLSALTLQLEQHERVLAELVAQREAKATASLADCERTAETMAKQLEGCLFEKAEEGRAEKLDPQPERALSGKSQYDETVGYPIVIPPKQPED